MEKQRVSELKTRISHVQNETITSNQAQRRLLELKHAQQAQKAFVMALQGQIEDGNIYKQACRRQEKAIQQLEGILEDVRQPGAKWSKGMVSPVYAELEKAVTHLGHIVDGWSTTSQDATLSDQGVPDMSEKEVEDYVKQLEQQQQQLAREQASLEEALQNNSIAADDSQTVMHERLQVQIEALEQEIAQLAQQHVQAELELEVQLMEAELATEAVPLSAASNVGVCESPSTMSALDRHPSPKPRVRSSLAVQHASGAYLRPASGKRLPPLSNAT
eukprot:TRINITY_DN6739_c0_g1_i1.p1 TRINITY_DN6739_c0_g1~~TRINITY_DN6739_c0_g1_i1.p1  ORF type:complete len:275 (+),score=62.22 TRINITY_DN6739_c0_g1_i1:326-1150(+)